MLSGFDVFARRILPELIGMLELAKLLIHLCIWYRLHWTIMLARP